MGKREFYEEEKRRKIIAIFSVVLILTIAIFLIVFVMYNRKLRADSARNLESLGKMTDIVENDDFEATSFSSDLSMFNATSNTVNSAVNTSNTTNTESSRRNVINKTPVASTVINTTNSSNTTNTVTTEEVPQKKELAFIAPVSGEILKDFAQDNLIYSNTLEEWTTHPGIDIKADKTSIVKASEAGKIESIKNDPRYGLTVTIVHDDGYKTVYSNLLTAEFVSENEIVEKGQTIGTIGETASFEVADESHLHFEMYKDNNVVNPTIYLKDE